MPVLMQMNYDLIAVLLSKTSKKHEIFNKVVQLFPVTNKEYHWRSIVKVLNTF